MHHNARCLCTAWNWPFLVEQFINFLPRVWRLRFRRCFLLLFGSRVRSGGGQRRSCALWELQPLDDHLRRWSELPSERTSTTKPPARSSKRTKIKHVIFTHFGRHKKLLISVKNSLWKKDNKLHLKKMLHSLQGYKPIKAKNSYKSLAL